MNKENINPGIEPVINQAAGEKTFTQDDVNRIVQDRLAKDREKASKELGERAQELAKLEFRLNSRQKLIDRGYPESILEALNCNSEKEFDNALDVVDRLIKERTLSPEEKAEIELKLKAAGSAPRFTERSKPKTTVTDPIRKAMNL